MTNDELKPKTQNPKRGTLFSKRSAFITGLILIALGLLANEWTLTAFFSSDGLLSPRSVVIIWVFDALMVATGLVLVISRSFARLIDLFVGLAFTAFLIFAAEKVFYRLNHPSSPPTDAPPAPQTSAERPQGSVHQEGTYTQNFFRDDELLGYVPQPDARVNSIKKLGDDLVYDVEYTIDEYSRRVTSVENEVGRDKFILFFGGSFVFGEGLNDDETLPFHVGDLAPQYRPYNYGSSGYGPQQMLAKLQSDDLTREAPESDGVAIYVFIDGHVERALGSMYVYNAWGDGMPYYTLDWDGNLVRKRDFRTGRPLLSTLYELLGKSQIAAYYHINIPAQLSDRHYAFAVRVIAEARDIFRQKYNSDEFYVLIYPDEGDYFEDMQPHLDAAGLKYLNYDEMMELDPDEGLSIAGDGHPTSKAHRIVAQWLVEDLGIGEKK